jgi:hypothetical protein
LSFHPVQSRSSAKKADKFQGRSRMKKINFFAVLTILIVGSIFVFQNRIFFLSTESIILNLGFIQYRTPDIHVGLFFFITFFIGFIISYFFNLTARFNSQKTIKNLNEVIALQRKKIKVFEKKGQGSTNESNQMD